MLFCKICVYVTVQSTIIMTLLWILAHLVQIAVLIIFFFITLSINWCLSMTVHSCHIIIIHVYYVLNYVITVPDPLHDRGSQEEQCISEVKGCSCSCSAPARGLYLDIRRGDPWSTWRLHPGRSGDAWHSTLWTNRLLRCDARLTPRQLRPSTGGRRGQLPSPTNLLVRTKHVIDEMQSQREQSNELAQPSGTCCRLYGPPPA